MIKRAWVPAYSASFEQRGSERSVEAVCRWRSTFSIRRVGCRNRTVGVRTPTVAVINRTNGKHYFHTHDFPFSLLFSLSRKDRKKERAERERERGKETREGEDVGTVFYNASISFAARTCLRKTGFHVALNSRKIFRRPVAGELQISPDNLSPAIPK